MLSNQNDLDNNQGLIEARAIVQNIKSSLKLDAMAVSAGNILENELNSTVKANQDVKTNQTAKVSQMGFYAQNNKAAVAAHAKSDMEETQQVNSSPAPGGTSSE